MFDGAIAKMQVKLLDLPQNVGVWTKVDSMQLIDSTNIFDYMNGGGELYLGYGFNYLEVHEYTAKNQPKILVELYFMKTSDDAFGLLSLDWGGEPINYNPSSPVIQINGIAPSSRCLYGSGLLRIWSENIYARIMAFRETDESRAAIIALGQTITENSINPKQPQLLQTLPQLEIGWSLRQDRIGYFRSHLVLNSLFYISHQNILNLDHSTEAVTAPYEKIIDGDKDNRIQILVVHYKYTKHAQKAFEHFHTTYLQEQKQDFKIASTNKLSNFYNLEDGWLGYKLCNQALAIVFACPEQESARNIINHVQFNKLNME